MTSDELQNLSDDDLIALYEQARTQPRDPETKRIRRALEHRTHEKGGQVLNSETGVRYVWDDGQESIIRGRLGKEHAQATCRALGRTVAMATAQRSARANGRHRGH